jgi:prevent-host-death family protein
MTRTVGAFEAKNRLSELLQIVENGEEVTITRHGRPVARLVPADRRDPAKVREAIEWLRRTREQRSLGGLRIKDLIEAGRKY